MVDITKLARYALILTIILLPTAIAPAIGSWTTSASAPASFRPNRSVTFSYTIASGGVTDLPIDWMVHLWTCTDSNSDNQCAGADARLVDWTEKRIQANGGATASITWTVTLPTPEAGQLAYFVPRCTNGSCTAQAAPSAGDTKSIAFQLHFTNSWTRSFTVPGLAQNGTTGPVTYRLASSNADDPDLAGTGELFTTPNASAERSEGTRSISVLANAQQTLTWLSVSYSPTGRQQERLVDSTTSAQAFANASVLDVHLHAIQPRANYTSGSAFGLYFTLEGHGTTPDPALLQANVQLILRNGTFVLSNTTTRTDANGTMYAGFQAAADLNEINWTANTTVTWNGFAFAPQANGTIDFVPPIVPSVDLSSVTALRADVANQTLHGVHLDELGTHNLLLEVGRVALYASLIVGILLIIVFVSFRV